MLREYIGHRRKLLMLFLILCMTLIGVCPVLGADRVSQAKSNVQTGGNLETASRGVRYRKADGTYLKNTWASVNGKVYYFKKNGYAAKGWFTFKKLKYHAETNGEVEYNKQIRYNGNYYYLKSNGRMATDCWLKIGSEKYYFNENGIRDTYPLSKAKYLFVGDSRTHGMALSVNDPSCAFVYKDGSGYAYLTGGAQTKILGYLKNRPGLIVIFNYGVNDIANVDNYIAYYRKLIKEYPNISFNFMAVNPITYSNAYISNAKIKAFNKKIKAAFTSKYIKTYTYLKKKGFETNDGLHYTAATYQKIYKYTLTYAK